MRTSTEFISKISANKISTSFDFHLSVRFSGKGGGGGGEMCIVRVCVCICTLLCRSLVTPRHRCVMMHEDVAYKDRF